MNKQLIAIPFNTMYLADTDMVTFRQDNVYVFEYSASAYEDYCAKDERDDYHYADLPWLEENFELYQEQPAKKAEIIEVTL